MSKIINGREVPTPFDTLRKQAEFTITNITEDFDVDADGAVAVIGDGFATLVRELQEVGLLGGTTS